MKSLLVLALGLPLLAGSLSAGSALAANAPAYIAKAVADPSRPKADREADALRDPADTLAFAGVRPGMKVIEMFPGGGYFSRLILDVVGPFGHVYGVENKTWGDAVKADQALNAGGAHPNFALQVRPFGEFGVGEKVDLVWVTQNYHDLKIAKFGEGKKAVDTAAFNKRVFDALKPGGTYFILDHQANPGTTLAQIETLHRIEKAQVIKEVTAAGFRLAGEGTFLHRASDDHTKPIFDASVKGRTDQYALKFVRP